jgi:hypothetical protein
MKRIKARNKSAFINSSFILLFSMLSFPAFSQFKYEREYPLKEAEVPSPIVQFIDSITCVKSLKYFKEESQEGESIEAKFSCNSEKYSVEFSIDGVLQDVEVELKKKDLKKEVLLKLEEVLKDEFEEFKLLKIQKQFKGERNEILQQLRKNGRLEAKEQYYEIVLKGRKIGSKKKRLFEYTFGEDIQVEKRLEIPLRDTDNLEF